MYQYSENIAFASDIFESSKCATVFLALAGFFLHSQFMHMSGQFMLKLIPFMHKSDAITHGWRCKMVYITRKHRPFYKVIWSILLRNIVDFTSQQNRFANPSSMHWHDKDLPLVVNVCTTIMFFSVFASWNLSPVCLNTKLNFIIVDELQTNCHFFCVFLFYFTFFS